MKEARLGRGTQSRPTREESARHPAEAEQEVVELGKEMDQEDKSTAEMQV